VSETVNELVSNATKKDNKIEMKKNQSDELLLQIKKLLSDTIDQQARLNG